MSKLCIRVKSGNGETKSFCGKDLPTTSGFSFVSWKHFEESKVQSACPQCMEKARQKGTSKSAGLKNKKPTTRKKATPKK